MKRLAHGPQVTGHQREEIGGLGPGVVPRGPTGAAGARIAVGQQDGRIRKDAHIEGSEHIGAVGIVGDAAETLASHCVA